MNFRNEDFIETFKIKVKFYNNSNYHTSDKRIFKLIKDSMNDIYTSNNSDEITILTENMLTKNKNEISKKLDKSKNNFLYKNLKEEFDNLKIYIKEFENILKYYDKTKHLSKETHTRLDILRIKITYILIELKTSLNLDLNDIAINDIEEFCDLMAYDINNENYQSLDIQSHIFDYRPNFSYNKLKK